MLGRGCVCGGGGGGNCLWGERGGLVGRLVGDGNGVAPAGVKEVGELGRTD